ncbi:uncharacterized protein PSFLO_06395 [Pseudozyma flocculosa]|uniref:Uncharacterized protein n=1 Tax=Pseudozyma flocculosa TaxID=84751 RepID=A0A5C3F8X4_9BASI|nr:uncharacterized protein PSFLO_06395 [Pseudozyma flocculosa]
MMASPSEDPRPFGALTAPLRLLLHATALYSSYFAFTHLGVLEQLLDSIIPDLFGGQSQFLTMNGLGATTATFAVALLRDLVPSLPLGWLKTALLSASLPYEFLITLLYWGLRLYDPSLVVPPKTIYDPADPGQVLRVENVPIPLAIDASLHGFPGLFLLIEYLAFSRARGGGSSDRHGNGDRGRKTRLAWCVAAGLAYVAYPLLEALSAPQRLVLYSGCLAIVLAASVALEKVHDALHGHARGPTVQSGGKKRA